MIWSVDSHSCFVKEKKRAEIVGVNTIKYYLKRLWLVNMNHLE